jgi:hypothetical protein
MVLAGATQGGADRRVLDGNAIEQRYSTTSHDSFVEDLAMTQTPNIDSLVGKWTYRSFISNPDLKVQFQ